MQAVILSARNSNYGATIHSCCCRPGYDGFAATSLRLARRCAVEVIQYVIAHYLLFPKSFSRPQWRFSKRMGNFVGLLFETLPYRSSSTAMQHSYKVTTI